MPIQLTPRAEARVREKVRSGHYPSPEAAIDVALRLLDAYDRRLARLRRAIATGDEGEALPWTPFLVDELIREVEEMQLRGEGPDPDDAP